jgi:hypothetical protein
MQVSNVRPVVSNIRPAVITPAKPVEPTKVPVKAQAGGQSGFGGLLKALFLDGWGSLSGLLSIGNDMKELRTDSENKTAHAVEVAGDVLNIISWPTAFIPGVGPAIAGAANLLGLAVKVTGEMMAGKK